jgi:sugar lactone lactonase YvrE
LNRKKIVRFGVTAAAVVATLAYFLVVVPRIVYGSSGVKVKTVRADFGDLDGAFIVDVGKGCENLCLEPASLRVYVTDCWGNVHLVDGPSRAALRVVKSAKLTDGRACGIDRGPGGFLYVAACDGDRRRPTGGIFKVDRGLRGAIKIAGDYPGLNGLALDGRGDIYFAASNMSFLNGRGAIYEMRRRKSGRYREAAVFLPEMGCVDGVFYDAGRGRICFTERYSGLATFRPGFMAVTRVLDKAAVFDFYGDSCVDAGGDYWLADPGGFLKRYDAGKRELTRYKIKGCGRPASCRMRVEDGEEIVYVTELKRRGGPASLLSTKCDGRGLVAIPLKALRGLEERR